VIVVKDQKKLAKQSSWKKRAVHIGRPYGDPKDVRSTRMIQRIHPHLVGVLEQRAREYGITKSQFIERILIDHLNHVEGAQLDSIGRWLDDRSWQDWQALHRRDQFPRSRLPLEVGKAIQAEADIAYEVESRRDEELAQPSAYDAHGKRSKKK
jgi:hypothetical protein